MTEAIRSVTAEDAKDDDVDIYKRRSPRSVRLWMKRMAGKSFREKLRQCWEPVTSLDSRRSKVSLEASVPASSR